MRPSTLAFYGSLIVLFACSSSSTPDYTVIAELPDGQIARFGTTKHNLVFTDPSVVTLARGTKLAASLNRQWFVYHGNGEGPDACAGICRMKADGSDVKKLQAVNDDPQLQPQHLAISNDGKMVAYNIAIKDDTGIVSYLEVLKTNTGDIVRLASTPGSAEQYTPEFLASGAYIYTPKSGNGVEIYNVEGQNKQSTLSKGSWFHAHPNKDEIIYADNAGKVLSFAIATEKETELATIPSGEISKKLTILSAVPLDLSPDGQTLAVAYTGGNPTDVLNQNSGVSPTDTIGRIRLGGGSSSLDHWIEPQQIAAGSDPTDFTPDGTHLVFGVVAGAEPRAQVGPIGDGSAGPILRGKRISAIFAVE